MRLSYFIHIIYFLFLLTLFLCSVLIWWEYCIYIVTLTLTQGPACKSLPFRPQCMSQRLLHFVTIFPLWDSTHGLSTHSPLTCPPEREKRNVDLSIENSPSSEADSCSASQHILQIWRNSRGPTRDESCPHNRKSLKTI